MKVVLSTHDKSPGGYEQQISELEESLFAARFYAKKRLSEIRRKERELDILRRLNQDVLDDLNEYREILCNKQKQIDVLIEERDRYKAQAEQARAFAERLISFGV